MTSPITRVILVYIEVMIITFVMMMPFIYFPVVMRKLLDIVWAPYFFFVPGAKNNLPAAKEIPKQAFMFWLAIQAIVLIYFVLILIGIIPNKH